MRRVVIAGTGRAGTTLVVELLHELGLDTGSDGLAYSDAARAGLETRLTDPAAPQVVKDPTIDFNALFAAGSIGADRIERILLPISQSPRRFYKPAPPQCSGDRHRC